MNFILVSTLVGYAGLTSAEAGGFKTYGYGSSSSDHYVSGYTRSNGSYVEPHYQTNSNGTQYDNYNSRGNYNYHNGAFGTENPQY